LQGCGIINGNVTVKSGGSVQTDCNGGLLAIHGAVTNNGVMSAVNGSTLEFYGPVINNGTLDIRNGSVIFNSSFINNGVVLTANDIGLHAYDGTTIIKLACEEPGTTNSPVRFSKNGTNYGILLTATNTPNASKFRIQTSSGVRSLLKLP
jgi:hypothetical protein